MPSVLTRRSLFAYAILGFPVGFIGLPLYVHLPKYYAEYLPLSLSVIGGILFLTRLLDCLADPWIGWCNDRFPAARKSALLIAALVMGAGVTGLFALPDFATQTNAGIWLGILMTSTYLAYSVLSMQLYTRGLSLAQDYTGTVRVSAWRESLIIAGVLVASALPQVLAQTLGEKEAYQWFSITFIGVLVAGVAVWLITQKFEYSRTSTSESPWEEVKRNPMLRWVFAVFFANAIPPAITATLFLFFVSDVLKAESQSGTFLGIYFLSAVLSMPFWTWLAARIGKRRSLMWAMALAISSFVWAYGLGEGQVTAFLIICLLSGAALGGDLAILPSMLADVLSHKTDRGGIEFGIWNFISKFTLALAAGIALPMLALLGYTPEDAQANLHALSISYALLPCMFKLLALCLLYISPLDTIRRIS